VFGSSHGLCERIDERVVVVFGSTNLKVGARMGSEWSEILIHILYAWNQGDVHVDQSILLGYL